jgi:hypothetical protein
MHAELFKLLYFMDGIELRNLRHGVHLSELSLTALHAPPATKVARFLNEVKIEELFP